MNPKTNRKIIVSLAFFLTCAAVAIVCLLFIIASQSDTIDHLRYKADKVSLWTECNPPLRHQTLRVRTDWLSDTAPRYKYECIYYSSGDYAPAQLHRKTIHIK
ncbi:MAG: hypothetical protein E6R03_11590 [Hyphomicrobiaceae bacterium]|nr:MAG: hypothetical protein E6R03_11590 [Hyphomicrobiaceae bacterium]